MNAVEALAYNRHSYAPHYEQCSDDHWREWIPDAAIDIATLEKLGWKQVEEVHVGGFSFAITAMDGADVTDEVKQLYRAVQT